MRILYIDQYAGGPSLGMEFRTNYLAREWQSAGHEVLVVTGSFSHLRVRQLEPGFGVSDDMRLFSISTPTYPANGPRRFLNILAFHLGLRRLERRMARWRPDVVVAASTHPLDVRSAHRVARHSDAQFVYEVRDLWPLTPRMLSDMSPRHPMIAWMQREEDFAYRNADLVVSLLPRTKPYMVAHGLAADKWVYIPNGVSVTAAAKRSLPPDSVAAHHAEVMEGLRERFPVILAYAGTQGPANALPLLLEHAHDAAVLGIGIVLIGDGPDGADLRRECEASNVVFLSRVPREDIAGLLAHADAAYAGLAPSPLYEYGIGMNKVWDYMAAGVPILECTDSPHSPTLDAACGWRADSSDPDSVVSAFRLIAAASTEEREKMGRRGQEYVMRDFTEPKIAQRYLTSLGRVGAGSASGRADRSSRSGD